MFGYTPDIVANLSIYQFAVLKKHAYVDEYITIANIGMKQKDYDDLMADESIKFAERKNNRGRVDTMKSAIEELVSEGISAPTIPQISARMALIQNRF